MYRIVHADNLVFDQVSEPNSQGTPSSPLYLVRTPLVTSYAYLGPVLLRNTGRRRALMKPSFLASSLGIILDGTVYLRSCDRDGKMMTETRSGLRQ